MKRPGEQIGFLGVPQSTNTAGWATQYLPIAVIKNGKGPTALSLAAIMATNMKAR